MGDTTIIYSNWNIAILHFLISILSAIALKHVTSIAPLARWSFTGIFAYAIYGMLHYSYPTKLPTWCGVLANSLCVMMQLLGLTLYTSDAIILLASEEDDSSYSYRFYLCCVSLLIIAGIHVFCSPKRYYIKALLVMAYILWNAVNLVQIQKNDWFECPWYGGMILLLVVNSFLVTILFNWAFGELHLEVNCIEMSFFIIFALKSLNELAFLTRAHTNVHHSITKKINV